MIGIIFAMVPDAVIVVVVPGIVSAVRIDPVMVPVPVVPPVIRIMPAVPVNPSVIVDRSG